jgi:hypothetical protein
MLLTPKRARPGRSRLRAAPRPERLPALVERPRHAAQRLGHRPRETAARRDEPDVVLDVPTLHVDEIDLQLDDLKARVALEAHVLDLLRLDVGVAAELRGVSLQIKAVEAQALLKVHLDNLTQIVDRVKTPSIATPQILDQLTERIGATLDDIAQGVGPAVEELGTDAHAPDATASHNALPK